MRYVVQQTKPYRLRNQNNMSNEFRLYTDSDKLKIEKLSYPRFTGIVTFNGFLSDIEDIEVDEDVLDAMDIATALRDAGEFILTQKANNE